MGFVPPARASTCPKAADGLTPGNTPRNNHKKAQLFESSNMHTSWSPAMKTVDANGSFFFLMGVDHVTLPKKLEPESLKTTLIGRITHRLRKTNVDIFKNH
jgi:hypothetical protein